MIRFIRKRDSRVVGFDISKIDEEHATFDNAYESLRGKFGKAVTPFVIPLFDETGKAEGVINLVAQKVFKVENGKLVDYPVPENKKAKEQAAKDKAARNANK
mgnify:CR=1 FL=1